MNTRIAGVLRVNQMIIATLRDIGEGAQLLSTIRRRAILLRQDRRARMDALGRLREWARAIRRDAHALYLASRDPRTPWYAKALAIIVAGYALSPIDLIPDFIPVLGYLDDLLLLPLGIAAAVAMIPPEVMAEHRASAAAAQDRPVSRTAAVIIVGLWIVALFAAAVLAWRWLR